jgi:2,4-dienoyl-CoA reductase-like NADH-dependent reductase (Old Yellow Enzyme family)
MSQASLDTLFQPFSLGSLHLKNRIVMAPMTRSFAPAGIPGPNNAAYYRRRAEGGVGLILSEGTVVNRPASRNGAGIPFFYGEAALSGWQHVIDEVHAAGGAMGPQIWHVGAAEGLAKDWVPEGPIDSPSGIVRIGQPPVAAMTDEAIADTIDAFGRAAASARQLGFDVVEIHAAHGYLIDQFFWSMTNQRADRYGGAALAQRMQFAVEVVRSVRGAVGPDFPVILRLSQWKLLDYAARIVESPKAMAGWLMPLVEAGADALHCSQRRFWEPEFPEIDGEEGLNFAGWAKKLTGAVTITVGSVGLNGDMMSAFSGKPSEPAGLEGLLRRLERAEFDLVAIGRPLLSDAAWANKLRNGEPLRGFSPADMGQLV